MNCAAKVYTHKIFKLFEEKLLNGIATTWSEVACNDNVGYFEVVGESEKSRIRTVIFNASTMDISCSCKKFESMGLLCSHALKILVVKNVSKLSKKIYFKKMDKRCKEKDC